MVHFSIVLKVKEDYIPRLRRISPASPSMSGFEPVCPGTAYSILRYDPCLYISALIPASTDKACAPVHMAAEAIPLPKLVAVYISQLSLSDFYYCSISGTYLIEVICKAITLFITNCHKSRTKQDIEFPVIAVFLSVLKKCVRVLTSDNLECYVYKNSHQA